MRRLFVVVVVVSSVLWAAAPAMGVWGGEDDGDRHPMVGAIYVDWDEDGTIVWGEQTCSGSYVGWSTNREAQVFLTAAHCLAGDAAAGFDTFWVSFDPEPMEGDGIPDGLIRATSFVWDPRYEAEWKWGGHPYDSGILLLPAGSVKGVAPVRLPTAGLLDDLQRTGDLRGSLLELVGYGTFPTWHEPGGPQFSYDVVRRTASAEVAGVRGPFLLFHQNTQATDLGGVCYWDSGSPNLIPGTRIAVATAVGVVGWPCNALGWGYRLDTPAAREFLGEYLTLP